MTSLAVKRSGGTKQLSSFAGSPKVPNLGMNFDINTEIPGNLAGGIGGSDVYGADSRKISGKVKLFRLVDTEGKTIFIHLQNEF